MTYDKKVRSHHMNVIRTELPEVLILEPQVFKDDRGSFFESYNQRILGSFGIKSEFVQDNHSSSSFNVLRGLHYQIQQAQGKLVRVAVGEVFDVAVDIRRSSATFGKWVGVRLSAENKRVHWIPVGFAHGFVVLSDAAELLYKTTDYYSLEYGRAIRWDDPDLAIKWPIKGEPILSTNDRVAKSLQDADLFP